jgi:hypothetical protein
MVSTSRPCDLANFTRTKEATYERDRNFAGNRRDVLFARAIGMPGPTAGVILCTRFECKTVLEIRT